MLASIFGTPDQTVESSDETFIFDARNGIHIIDLRQDAQSVGNACAFLSETVRKGGKVLFVGTKKQASRRSRNRQGMRQFYESFDAGWAAR